MPSVYLMSKSSIRLEFVKGTSNKFWEGTSLGSQLTIHFGRIGTAGQVQIKSFASPAAALAMLDKLVAEKTHKGYVKTKTGAAKGGGTKENAKTKTADTQPSTIFLTETTWKDLQEGFPGSVGKLMANLKKGKWKDAPENARAFAERIAKILKGVAHSSDVDCSYYPLVFAGVDLTNDASFFRAMGVQRKSIVPTCDGEDAAELKTYWALEPGKKKPKSLKIMSRIAWIDEEEDLDDYFSRSEQKALLAAGDLMSTTSAAVTGILIPEKVTKILFLAGQLSESLWAGVLTGRIDT